MVNSSSPSQPMAVGNIPPSSNGSKTQQQQQSSPPTSNAVPSLLLKLLEACAKHKRKHDQDKKDKKSSCNINNNTLQQQDWCHKELKSFQNIFPRLESTIHARHTFSDEYQQQNCNNGDTNVRRGSSSILTEINDGEDAVGHICALYRAIARGSFCPHAYHYLFVNGNNKEVCNDGELVATDGNIAIGILPRISKLLQALSLDPVRIALSPIPEHISTLDESMKIYYGGEDVGATIATLLNMLQDDQLRLAAVHDLINLSDDLSTIDESGALFEPPLSEGDGGEGENHQNNGNKIRIQIFTEVAHILQKGSNTNANTEYPKDMSVQIPSRRSLLALQCEVWESLRRLVPKVTKAQGDERNNIELINSLLSSSGSTSFLSPPSSSQEPHNQDWSYSPVDVSIHSLLLLRTKMAIVGLFTDIISWADLDTSVQIHLALISVEAIKQQLLWDQHNCSEDIPKETRKLENSLDSMYSRAVSKFMALAVLFPNDTAAKNDLWSHTFPHLMDCIPLMTDSSNDCLRKVVLRAVYIMLSRTGDSHHQTPSLLNSSTTSFIDLFRNRCLVRGYFSHLFGLVKDCSESVNGPAVSIIVRLLESFGCEDLVETACLDALSSIEGDIDPTSDNLNRDSPLIRLGTKRRKIESSHEGKGSTSPSASIQSAFTHAVADALDDTQRIFSRLTEGSKRTSSSDGCVSLVSESETHLLRSVAGTLRVLLSMCGKTNGNSFTDKVITRLFECVTAVCGVLVKQKSDDKLVHVEPRLFRSAVSSVVAVGLHACRALKGTSINHLSAREAISYCALSAVPLIEFDRGCQIDGSMSSNILLEANNKNNMGGGICSRLVEMIGASAKKADISLYGLTCDESEDECDAFAFDEIMPLQCRCILLATVCPVVSSSEQYEPTMSSIRCILASPTPSQAPPAIVKTALLGLPTLFLSLAQRKDDNVAASTKYLTLMMNSFNFEDLVIRYTKPDIEEGIQVSAFLTLSRLVKIYTAASLVVGHDDASDNSQSSKASSYLWHHLNPTTNGIHTVLLSLLSSAGDDDAFTTSKDAAHFHDSLSMPALSNRGSSALSMQGDSPQQCMSSLIYLRSVLAVAPESKLRSSNTLEFFTDKRHYDILVNIVKKMDNSDMEEGSLSDEQMPPPVWVFLMPFLSRDAATQMYAASTFGKTLLNDECKVLFACFRIPESEMRADQISCEAARRAVNSLFVEIDFILRLCGLDRDVLISKELDNLPGYNTNFDNNTPERISNVGAAIGIFSSLCKWAPLNTHIGNFIIEGSVLALVRIWISATGGYAFDSNSLPDDPTSHFSLASHAFQGLNTIFKQNNGDEVCSTIKNSMSKIFSEFFLPQYDIVASTRYRLLCLFIGSFLLPDSSTGQSQPAHNTFEVSVATEINTYIDSVYPSIIVHFVKAEDHEAIQMCAAFRMYLLSEGKRMAREEKRVQKKELNEYIMGTRYESKHSGQLARSLIPGVEISTNKLIENAKLLCIKKDVILYVLPQLLLNPNRAPLRFFTTKLCQSELDYPDILQEFGLLVLKRLVWELGADDPEEDKEEEMFNTSAVGNYHKRKDVVLALSKGYLLKERSEADKAKHLLLSPSQESTDNIICPKAASRWVAPNFMYLLMNLVNKKWDKRSKSDKFQVIKCLRSMLQFITSSSDSPQYMSPIMTAINDAISDNCHNPKLDFIATATLFDYIKIVASDASQVVGDNLTSITVALFPLFDGRKDSPARRRAVEMLEWLASGEANDSLPLRFNEIPLLPFTQDLAKVRSILVKKGVQLDDIRLLSQHSGQEEDIDDSQLKSRFHNRMNILSKLIVSHENQNVRKVVITHMTDLIKANRDLFHELVVNEELSSINFLTVVHEESEVEPASCDDDVTNGGFITKLLIRLLSRCVDEPRPEIRDAIASCLGEIGAIDPNRLGKEINSTQIGQESDDSSAWRLRNPPWQTQVADYQLRLVSRHLVSGLKSASVAIDGHKISFSIQELLKILDGHFGGENENDMTPLLKEKLQQADVFNIVEPFWTTNYKQVDVIAAKTPPFFIKSSTYFSWLSSFCRFLVTRSYANKKSVWGDFFHACRSAIRSKACVGVAEFLLPLFVLDTMCFGTKNDKDVVVDEFIQVLTFDEGDTTSKMDLKEREKAANAVFSVMDVLRYWLEKEVERKHQPTTRGGRSKGRATNNSTANDGAEFSWPATESIKKTEQLLKRIPLSSCAVAASKVGMRARALQFLEMEGRTKAQANDGYKKDDTKGISRFLKSDFLLGIDSQLTQVLHGQLNDFDTMVFVAEKNHEADLTKRLTEEAVEREMYEDWEGAFQAYEQLLDSRLINNNNNNQSSSTLDDVENSKASAQKGIIRCLLKLGRLDSVLNQASGMSSKQSTIAMGNDGGGSVQISDELLPSAAEAAWRLGDWDQLDNLVNNVSDESALDSNASFQLEFGRTMHSLHSKTQENFVIGLKDSRESIMSSLSSAARDGYTSSYPYLTQLHALREVECVSTTFFDKNQSNFQQSFINVVSSEQWSDRLELSTSDTTGSNAILNTRLGLSRMANEPTIEGLMWLDIGKVARKGGLHRVAEQSLIQANASFCKSLNVSEKARESIGSVKLQIAKLKHAIGETTTALKLIEDDIPDSIFLMDDKQLNSYVSSDKTESTATARRILQSTEWMACDGLKSSTEIKDRYQTVLKLAPNWERAHFNYAKFLDSLYESRVSSSSGDRGDTTRSVEECQDYLLNAVQHYGMSLQLGQKHVYQALPRLLAMWLEFTSLSSEEMNCEESSIESDRLAEKQGLMNKMIKSLASKIPEHLFYTALPQLISRVEHCNNETAKNVAMILRAVLAKYPRQAMWYCGWLRFSKSDQKKKIGDEVFHGAQKMLKRTEKGKATQNVLSASKSLFQFFISLAQFVPKGNHSSVKMKVPKFDTDLTNFIPPIQAALSLSPGALGERSADTFPPLVPRMRAFNPELKIMQSKAKPKKVSIFAVPTTVASRGEKLPTDGHSITQDAGEMHFLVKQEAKGDLRKDSRVQDLNNVINRLFAQRKGASGPNSRRKRLRLQLRTFSVVCLAEDCGILEWVPNTESLRSVVTETYNPLVPHNSIHRRGSRITNFADPELRETFQRCQDVYFKKGNLDLATKKFDELVLKQYLPVLYWWFTQNFASPHAWYEARTNFTLSTAVWSAVGHIIGLGDRHSENILIDKESGECVHVDFDCIFDKGLLLPRPEVIPFRLTPNMLDAFGPTGADGMYTGALTESMRTLRLNKDTLLSVLEPFLNDPVINFKSKNQQKSKEDKVAKDTKTAMASMAKIQGRLNGEYNITNPNKNKKNKKKDATTMVDTTHFTKLSVEGQVQKMIMEATDKENLVQVYVGWMPWI